MGSFKKKSCIWFKIFFFIGLNKSERSGRLGVTNTEEKIVWMTKMRKFLTQELVMFLATQVPPISYHDSIKFIGKTDKFIKYIYCNKYCDIIQIRITMFPSTVNCQLRGG